MLPKNRFARSVSVLAGGTAAGQIIVVAASPILTRLYSPEDFGLLAVYAGLLGILGVIASLRYQLAIPLPESDEEGSNLVVLSLMVVLGITALSAVVIGLFGTSIVEVLNTPKLKPYLWLLPIGLLLTGVYQVFQYWAIRIKAFPAIAKTKLTQAVGMVAMQIGGYALGPIALLLGRVVGQSAGIVSLARLTLRKDPQSFSYITRADLYQALVSYRNFPLLSTWTGLSSSAGTNLPPLLIATFLGTAPAGIFALTHRVLSQPMAVVGKAVNDVFYRQATQAYSEGNLDQAVQNAYSSLAVLALPPTITIFLVAPEAFVVVFGSDWSVAGTIARWMTPWLFFQFVVSPCTGIYPIINRHGIALCFQISLLLSGVFSVVVGGVLLESLTWAVVLMSLSNSLVYLARVVTTFTIVGLRSHLPIIHLLKAAPLSFFVNLPIIALWASTGTVPLNEAPGMILLGLTFILVMIATKKNMVAINKSA